MSLLRWGHDATVSDDRSQDILGDVLNAPRSSPLTRDELAEDLAKRKELTIRSRHPPSEKLVNVWSAERASHNSLFSAKATDEMIG